MKPITHGGNVSAIRKRLGLGQRPLTDFSVSLNPLGPPPGAMAAARTALETCERYPEPGCHKLTEYLAEKHGVPAECVIVGAGTTELISLVGQSLREILAIHAEEMSDPEMSLSHLVEPTYAEYKRTSALNELPLETWNRHILDWRQEFFPKSANGIFWTGHPNNPTGRAWDRETLLHHIDQSEDLLTVVDEAYLPFLPDEKTRSVCADVVTRGNLLVLRSVTKVYAIAGLRVGYALASPDMVLRLRQFQEPWTVAAPAEAAALAALQDVEYLEKSVELIGGENIRQTDRLWDIPGIRPAWPDREIPAGTAGRANFILVSLCETNWTSQQIHDELARRGFLVRECANYAGLEMGVTLTGPGGLSVPTNGHLRFAVRSPEENDRLYGALADVMSRKPSDA